MDASLPEAGIKRKTGEDQVDTDDLPREMDQESPSKRASIEAISDLIGRLEAAENLAAIAAMDVVEVFSPKQLNNMVQRFGLRPGAAIDLEEFKPNGEEKWDLDRKRISKRSKTQ